MKKYVFIILLFYVQWSHAQYAISDQRLVEQRLPASFDELLKCNCIQQIYQDKKGLIWLATPLGLIRFDGYELKYFKHDPVNSKTIAANYVLRVTEDNKGNIWVGLNENGISCYDPVADEFTNYNISLADTFSQHNIVSIFVDGDDELWFSPGYAGLCHLDKKTKTFSTYRIVTKENCPHLSESDARLSNFAMDVKARDKNSLWLATPEGLFVFDKKSGVATPVRAKPVDKSMPADYNARRIIVDGNMLWIGGWASGIQSYDTKTGEWKRYMFSEKNKSVYTDNIVNDMTKKGPDEIWIASADKGLGVFNKKSKKTFFFSSDPDYKHLPGILANLVFRDRQQNVWVCFKEAFYKFLPEPRQVEAYRINSYPNQNNGLSLTNCVFEDVSGRYALVGTSYGDGILFNDNKLHETVSIPVKAGLSGRSTMHINGFIQRDSSSVWVLTGDLLLTLDLTSKKLSTPAQPMNNEFEWGLNNYNSFVKDAEDNLWISTPLHGIICYNIRTGSSDTYSQGDKNITHAIATNNINCIAQDSRDRIWYGSLLSSCLGYYDKRSKTSVVLNESGNGSDKRHSIKTYDFLNIDGNIYASTESGLLQFDCSGDKPVLIKKINAANGIGADWVKAAALGKNGNLWLLTVLGVCRYDSATNALTTIGKGSGIYKTVTGISYTQQKNIYLTGINYYYQINEASKPSFSGPIAPLITALKVDENEVNVPAMLSKENQVRINAHYTYFSFLYASPDMVNADKTNYSYMLEGYDKEWVNAGNRRVANYTNLPGGNYVFKVRASLGKENRYSSITSVPILIGTLFYRTPWFRALLAGIVLLILYMVYRYRLNKQMEINLLNNRTYILEKEKALVQYEILKQQLNPHFLFNSLAALSGLISTEPGKARTFLDKMTKIYRYILKSGNNELVNLSDEINFATTYINLQQTRYQQGLEINILVSEEDEGYKIVPVTIQNMVENAIKHNVISTEAPLIIDITVEDKYLVIKNNLQRKKIVDTSNRQGLTQLKALYSYLSKRPVVVEETDKLFAIKIPLI